MNKDTARAARAELTGTAVVTGGGSGMLPTPMVDFDDMDSES